VATVAPFSALRYDESVAGPLADLVAPPYDVLSEDDTHRLWHTSPNNIVHLTKPQRPDDAGRTLADWRRSGVLVEEEPALWWLTEEYEGPDGVRRTREGIVGTIEATPYSEGKVLPHEKTNPEVKQERLEILRETRTQLEPVLLLYDADPPVSRPEGDPVIEVDEAGVHCRLWKLDSDGVDLDVPLLIADGHHRYETAVAYRKENPKAERTLAVLVSSRDPGLEIFPTHRVVQDVGVQPFGFMTSIWDTDSLAMYRTGNFFRLETDDELDVVDIEQYELEGVEFTPDAEDAVRAVDDNMAQLVFLVRAPSVQQVLAYASRGETMPKKTTYFYPKLTSGLLLLPVG
jgi:uncharacterized protein (DUF1015 family)